jgi:hypothetical protein
MTSKEDEEFEQAEARNRIILRNQAKRAIELRSEDRDFHGL